MYEDYFELNTSPFGTNPDPAFIYWSKTHENSLAALRYGVMSGAQLTIVSGEIGAGKTTLVRHLLGELPEWVTIGLVSNAQAGRGELLHWILMALHIEFGNEPYVLLLERFQNHAVECSAAGRRLILIFDEAQNLSEDMLEELRLLSNINAGGEMLVQVILLGQPQLRGIIRRPSMVQFAQRVGASYHLETLTAAEVPQYIRHRLRKAGAQRDIFEAGACSLIAEATGGVPRLINLLCDLCLAACQENDRESVDTDMAEEVLEASRATHPFQQAERAGSGRELVPAVPLSASRGAGSRREAEPTLVLVNRVPTGTGEPAAGRHARPAAGAPRLVCVGNPTPHRHDCASEEFWIYENWISRRAVLHRSGCFYCNGGLGIGLGSGTPRGKWYGPFEGRGPAKRSVMRKAAEVRNCKICLGA